MTDVPKDIMEAREQFVRDAIRSAYDRGYNDARNASSVPGDGATSYRGRDMSDEISRDVLSRLSRLSALLAERERRTPDVVTWQPIETAPKDGTSILVAHELAVFSACWEKDGRETNTGQPGWIDGVMNRSEEYVVYEPTHWMPLPDLPAAPSLSSGAGRSEERG